jgi:high affinity Mn2+ porin
MAAITAAQTASPPADAADPPRWTLTFQATSIGQHHGAFSSPYQGPNSLPPHDENRVSLTGTVFFTAHITDHLDFVLNPELAGGKGFGGVTGIAGFPNGEIPRVAGATPAPYLARGYVRYSFRPEPVHISVAAGKFAATDFFDNNSYSHDPRTQFMNWSIMYNGAWDYPADVRGYTAGVLEEIAFGRTTLRHATLLEPLAANGPDLDTRIGKNRGQAVEWEQRYSTGVLRILGYLNREHGGTFRSALHLSPAHPDLQPTRRDGTPKYGFGINLEQALGKNAGLFGRYGWSDGKTESWAFTQIDRSLSGGISVGGTFWRRPDDRIGLGAARNYLSSDQRSFLAAGGIGFLIGEGRLNYHPEEIVETYYAWRVRPLWTVSADYQHIANPAYNRDRGPVSVASLRLHWER